MSNWFEQNKWHKFNPLFGCLWDQMDLTEQKTSGQTDGQYENNNSLPKVWDYLSERPQTESHAEYPIPEPCSFGEEVIFLFSYWNSLRCDLFWCHWHNFQYSLFMTWSRCHLPYTIAVGFWVFMLRFLKDFIIFLQFSYPSNHCSWQNGIAGINLVEVHARNIPGKF